MAGDGSPLEPFGATALETLIESVLLGIVQGIAEFLPISSSGHLVILGDLLHRGMGTQPMQSHSLELNVALHVGTLFSIFVIYRNDLYRLIQQPRLCAAIVAATIPAGTVGLLWKDALESSFETPLLAGCCLLITGGLLLAAQRWERERAGLEDLTIRNAFVVGLFQALALLPGVSRSGSTIAGGLLTGLRRDSATSFSFFIAIPAIGAAAVLTAKDVLMEPANGYPLPALLAGMATSFIVGCLALKGLIRIVARRKLHWFAYYCGVAGTATIVWQLIERAQG